MYCSEEPEEENRSNVVVACCSREGKPTIPSPRVRRFHFKQIFASKQRKIRFACFWLLKADKILFSCFLLPVFHFK